MCRILGLAVAPNPSDSALPIWKQLVASPNSLRNQAENGAVLAGSPQGHDDSWGIGWFDAAGRVSLVRQVGSAAASAYFVLTSEAAARGGAGSGPARAAIGHLRKASCGDITSENAHPVRVDLPRGHGGAAGQTADSLLVAHNGTIYNPLLSLLRGELAEAGRAEAAADSDTVVLAAYLGLRLQKAPAGQPVFETLAAALRHVFSSAAEIAPDGKLPLAYTAVNLILANADGLYALRQFSSDGEYYTLNARKLTEDERPGGGWIVASEPTDTVAEWQALTPGVLYFYPTDGSAAAMESDGTPLTIAVAA